MQYVATQETKWILIQTALADWFERKVLLKCFSWLSLRLLHFLGTEIVGDDDEEKRLEDSGIYCEL